MTPLTLLRLGVIGILSLLWGATLSCAQSFTFDFKSDEQSGIATSQEGPVSMGDWDWSTSGNPLDNNGNSGTLYFELFSGGALAQLDLAASDYLNWTNSNGLSDGTGVFDKDGEFISFTFGRRVQIEELDLAGLTGTDQVSLLKGSSLVGTYFGSDVVDSRFSPGVMLAPYETLTLRRDEGSFGFDAMTISAVPVPEPSSLLFSGIASIFCLWRYRKRVRD